MKLCEAVLCFFVGGSATDIIATLEASGHIAVSGFAALVPVLTLVAYVFIGATKNSFAVSQHAKFVLYGMLFS